MLQGQRESQLVETGRDRNRVARIGRATVPAGRKAAFTLRLDTDRHLRLRLASAVTGQSSQQLVIAALDAFLETLPEVTELAEQVPATRGKNGWMMGVIR